MIALLAAVPEETRLIRQSMQDIVQRSVNGLTVLTGKIAGHDICLTHSGIGKAAAAATAITLSSGSQPEALWLFGCGGAYPGSDLMIGDLALADVEIFGDEGVATGEGFTDLAGLQLPMRKTQETYFNIWPVDQELHDWAFPHLTGFAKQTHTALCSGPFVTVSTCTGTTAKAVEIANRTGGVCENMEGAAVALACQQLSVPLLEVRGISNRVEDRDVSGWDLPCGMLCAQRAIMSLLQTWTGQNR